jgi:hypothetical protein
MKINRKIFFTFFLLVFCVSVSFSQERKVLPVDEGNTDASFSAFREKTLEAAKRRDVKYILSILDARIKNSFGGNDGINEFKTMWKINSPKSEFWDEFIKVLSNGGTFDKESGAKTKLFMAPYTFTGFPDDLDVYDYQAIFGNNVNLRSKPDMNAPVVARLSYDIVKIDFKNSVPDKIKEGEHSWLKVETFDGKKGFVKAEFVRGSTDFRALFEKKNGVWKMTAFIAGD